MTSLMPIFVCIAIWVVWASRVTVVPPSDTHLRNTIFSQHVSASLLLSYFVLPSVSMVQFKSLRCSEIDSLGVRFLREDSGIDCDSPAHQTFVSRITPLVILYQLIPVMYFFLLYRVRDRLNPMALRNSDKGDFRGPSIMQSSTSRRMALMPSEVTTAECCAPMAWEYWPVR